MVMAPSTKACHGGWQALKVLSQPLGIMALAFWSSASFAASQPRPTGVTNNDLDDDIVIVTARRVKENAQQTPVSVTVVSGNDVGRLAINTPLDLNKVAGLGGAPIGTLTSVNFTLRGQGAAYGGQPGVISYFAEVPNFPLAYFDLDAIQVIKGPQGTLFGQTSTGGVVLFEPRRPTDKFEASAEVQVGNHEYRQLDAFLNVPIVSDRLLARLAFRLRDRTGWGRAIYADGRASADLNDVDNASVRATVYWRPTDQFENELIFAHDRFRSNGSLSPIYYADPRFMNPAVRNLVPASVPSIAAPWQFWTGFAPPAGQTFSQLLLKTFDRQRAAGPLTMFTDFVQRNRTVNNGWINQTTWDVPGLFEIKNIFGLRYSTTQGATYDQDASDLPLLNVQCRFALGATTRDSECAKVGGWPERTITDELRLRGAALDDKLQFQAGVFYLQGGSRRYREDTRPYIVFGSLSGDPANAAFCASVNVPQPCAAMSRTRTSSYAVFGQATYALLPELHLTGGYRETWDRTRTETTGKTSYLLPFNGRLIAVPVYGGTPFPGANTFSTKVNPPANGSYNLSIDWRVTDRVFLYAAHRSGYKSGGINLIANPGTPQRTYGPERAKDAEIGLKANFNVAGVEARLDVAAYHTWYSEIQQGVVIPGTAQTITTNLAHAEISGVEIEGSLRPTAWFRLDGNVAYTDASYSKWLEKSNCAAQYWRPQCVGQTGATAITIDHAKGRLEIGGTAIGFEPDRFANTSKRQWSIRPTLDLESWLGEDIKIAANVYHRGPYVDSVAVANRSKIAGVVPNPQPTVFGYTVSNPYDAPGYTLTDLRIDWRGIGGSQLSVGAGVTNVANKIYRVSSASAFEIIGSVYSLIGEPRMAFVTARYDF